MTGTNYILQLGQVLSTVLFVVGRWVCPQGNAAVPCPFLLCSILNKGELTQSFCSRMPFMLSTSRNHLLDFIFSVNIKTPKQGKGHHSLYVALQH